MNPNVQEYIKQRKSSGLTDEQIRLELKQTGWSDAQVDTVLPQLPKKKGGSNKTVLIIGIIVIVLAAAVAAWYFVIRDSGEVASNVNANANLNTNTTKSSSNPQCDESTGWDNSPCTNKKVPESEYANIIRGLDVCDVSVANPETGTIFEVDAGCVPGEIYIMTDQGTDFYNANGEKIANCWSFGGDSSDIMCEWLGKLQTEKIDSSVYELPDTDNWSEYKNADYNLSVKYPVDLQMAPRSKDGIEYGAWFYLGDNNCKERITDTDTTLAMPDDCFVLGVKAAEQGEISTELSTLGRSNITERFIDLSTGKSKEYTFTEEQTGAEPFYSTIVITVPVTFTGIGGAVNGSSETFQYELDLIAGADVKDEASELFGGFIYSFLAFPY